MTPKEAYERMSDFLGKKAPIRVIQEYEYVYGSRLRPGERLCVVKESGAVMWEDDLSDELAPHGEGIACLIE